MNQFIGVADVPDLSSLLSIAAGFKKNPHAMQTLGLGKRLGMVFLNPSLRTRLSTEIAARNLGMEVQTLNIADAWAFEFDEGAVMNANKVEHIKEAAGVLGQYMDIMAIRAFPGLVDKELDDSEKVMKAFQTYAKKPLLSLESATRHPLQSLADVLTIEEHRKITKPKVVLSWAPHVKALPQAVPHSFLEWTVAAGYDVHLAHPPGLELDPQFTQGVTLHYNQEEALESADFVYVKNWSKREPYGESYLQGKDWLLNESRLQSAPKAQIMHCLPVRRNIELSDDLLDGNRSLVMHQAANRVWAAQAVLRLMLESLS